MVEKSIIYLRLSSSGKKYRIYNIHLHSKNWAAFTSIMNNGKILERLNNERTSVISGQHMLVLGPLLRIGLKYYFLGLKFAARFFELIL